LLGGIDAWRQQNYPVVVSATLGAVLAESMQEEAPVQKIAAAALQPLQASNETSHQE